MNKRLAQKRECRRIAKERIIELFRQARKRFSKDRSLSHRYVVLARKIAMKYRVKIPVELQRQYCKHCFAYFVSGKTVKIRTHKGKVVYTCLQCKKVSRFPYKS
jgi:ribonuclease P protein subunit RPR2